MKGLSSPRAKFFLKIANVSDTQRHFLQNHVQRHNPEFLLLNLGSVCQASAAKLARLSQGAGGARGERGGALGRVGDEREGSLSGSFNCSGVFTQKQVLSHTMSRRAF